LLGDDVRSGSWDVTEKWGRVAMVSKLSAHGQPVVSCGGHAASHQGALRVHHTTSESSLA